MRGIRFLGDKRSEVIDYPDEEPDPGYVLLKMRSSGMCGSDLHRYRVPLPKEEAERDPVRPGHEPCGEVAVLGEGVEGLQIGDRILQHHYEGCGNCRMCRGRLVTALHRNGETDSWIWQARRTRRLHDCARGHLPDAARRIELRSRRISRLRGQHSVSRTKEVAAFRTRHDRDIRCRACRLAGVMFAAEMGARVISVDISGERLEMAKSAGASEVVDNSDGTAVEQILDLTYGEGADATLEAIGIHQTRLDAVQSTKIFGRCCFRGRRW